LVNRYRWSRSFLCHRGCSDESVAHLAALEVAFAPMSDSLVADRRKRTMARIAIDWAAYDLREKAFEQALAEGNATLVDPPLPNGGVLAEATDEQVALAAWQFKHRGQDLLTLSEWLQAKAPQLNVSQARPVSLSVLQRLACLQIW
jgi:hypothetical protein